MMKKLIILVVGTALASSLLFAAAEANQEAAMSTGVTAGGTESTGTEVVVTVNGEKILEKVITQEMDKRIAAQLKRMPEGSVIPESAKQQLRMQIVDMEVEKTLINQEMKKKKLTVTDDQVLNTIKTIAESRDETLEDVEKEIAESGMTLKDLVNQYRPQVQIETLMEAVKPESKVTEVDAKTFYDENPQSFEEPEQVRASHILIKFEPNATDEGKAAAREKIEGLLKRAKAGEDFAALATEYTEDPGSKDTGGEYTFPRGRMVKPFEDAAFSLNVGEISDVVETEYGYHIIKVLEKIEAKKVSYDEVKASLMQYLKQNKLREFWPEYRKNLSESATIEFSEKEKALREAARPPVSIPLQAPSNAAPAN